MATMQVAVAALRALIRVHGLLSWYSIRPFLSLLSQDPYVKVDPSTVHRGTSSFWLAFVARNVHSRLFEILIRDGSCLLFVLHLITYKHTRTISSLAGFIYYTVMLGSLTPPITNAMCFSHIFAPIHRYSYRYCLLRLRDHPLLPTRRAQTRFPFRHPGQHGYRRRSHLTQRP